MRSCVRKRLFIFDSTFKRWNLLKTHADLRVTERVDERTNNSEDGVGTKLEDGATTKLHVTAARWGFSRGDTIGEDRYRSTE